MLTQNQILSIYAVVIGILISPVMLNSYLPMVDISNHAARHYIAANLEHDVNLQNYYSYTFSWFGNSSSDIIRVLLGDHISAYNLVRLSTAFYMANFVFSTCVLYRVINGSWCLWPLASILVVFNGNFQWGFENYLVGSPFLVYAIAALVASENRPFLQRFLIVSFFTFVLFMCHTLIGLIFGAAVFGFEAQKTIEQQKEARLAYFKRNLLLAAPFILSITVFVQSSGHSENLDGSYTEFGNIFSRIDIFFSLSTERFYRILIGQNRVWKAAILVICILIFFLFSKKSGSRIKITSRLKGLVGVLLLVSLLTPSWLEGVAFVHYRTPFLLVTIFIGSTYLVDFKPSVLIAFTATIVVIAGGRIQGFHHVAKQHSEEVVELISLLEKMPIGSKLMPIYGKNERELWRYHSAAFAVTERQALIPTLFQGMHGLTINAGWKDYTTPTVPPVRPEYLTYDIHAKKYVFRKKKPYKYLMNDSLYYDNWEDKFTHILLINKTDIPLEEHLPISKLGSTDVYTLFRNDMLH